MRLLLDTHIALWAVYQPEKLPARALHLVTHDSKVAAYDDSGRLILRC